MVVRRLARTGRAIAATFQAVRAHPRARHEPAHVADRLQRPAALEPGLTRQHVARGSGIVAFPFGEILQPFGPFVGLLFDAEGACLCRIDLCAASSFGDRVLQPAKAVDQADLARGAAIPDAALGDGIDLLRRLVARAGDEANEAAINILDPQLHDLVEFGRGAAGDIGLARQRRGAHAVAGDTGCGCGFLERGDDRENADRSGDRFGLGKNAVGSC